MYRGLAFRFLFVLPLLSFTYIAQADHAIRFGILSIAPPARIHANWQPFIRYLSKELGHEVEIVIPRGFQKMKAAAAKGQVDIFYVNSLVFYRLKQEGKAQAVAQMENITGAITSATEIFVRSDSDIKTVEQLKGKSVAFVSPMGAGGYLAPRSYLYSKGVRTKEHVTEVFTENLSNSIHQVLLGEINAGTMCGVNFRLMGQKIDTGELRIIGKSSPYPESVVAARHDLAPELRDKIMKIIIAMSENQEGQKILQNMSGMKVKRFIPYDVQSELLTKQLLTVAEF